MSDRTTGEAIVEALFANGVDTVFGLPGAQTYPLWLLKGTLRLRLHEWFMNLTRRNSTHDR